MMKNKMNPLFENIEYKTEEEFKKLTAAIQTEINAGTLNKYFDKTWKKGRRSDWGGEYISIENRKMYRFNGSHYYSTQREPCFKGKWMIVREEKEIRDKKIYNSQYLFRAYEPGVYSKLEFEIEYQKQELTKLEFEWKDKLSNGGEHTRLIKSSVEYGIISAFEDLSPANGFYRIKLLLVRYHPIDSSFSLLHYASNRNLKRALFAEDEYPKIENGKIMRKFRPNMSIIKFNGE